MVNYLCGFTAIYRVENWVHLAFAVKYGNSVTGHDSTLGHPLQNYGFDRVTGCKIFIVLVP